MPSFCVVFNCCDRYGHAENISFHKFPFKRKELLEKWTDFAHRGPAWKPTKWSAICSQHFTPEDFNCFNSRKTLKKTAVPTIRVNESLLMEPTVADEIQNTTVKEPLPMKTSTPGKTLKHDEAYHDEEESDGSEEVSTSSQTKAITSPSGTKTNCRLCGLCSKAVVTFSTNFEIFGMIQKCFPTLNIQQDDNLPKDMCRQCLKRLESFSEFIDKVLEAQRELQKKFLIEKSNTKAAETRTLKIKQEPVVKVKQEVAEGFDSFLSDDLDMGIDECCEHEQETADEVEQKFGFYEFPMLNTQDIINNCDIMEIINLDDPFIDIPDDDMPGALQQTNKYVTQAHQLLQAHMLIDEHNYACPAEDLKEEWQIKKYYKQEKTETYEQHDAEEMTTPEVEEEFQNIFNHEEQMETAYKGVEEVENQRSTKPIVTSVSAIAETRLQFANEVSAQLPLCSKVNTNANDHLASSKRQKDPSSKPNIVVLNESIVKSTAAFQLHACAVCQLKFFSIDSLQQHVNFTHMNTPNDSSLPPMVSLPSSNITHGISETLQENDNDFLKQNTKTDISDVDTNTAYHKNSESYEDFSASSNKQQPQQQSSDNSYFNQQLKNFHSWQQNIKSLQLNALRNSAWSQVNSCQTTESSEHDNSKNLTACTTQIENQNNMQTLELNCTEIEKTNLPNFYKDVSSPPPISNSTEENVRAAVPNEHNFKAPLPHKSKTKIPSLKNSLKMKSKHIKPAHERTNRLHNVAENFQLLKQRYCLLLQKCKVLEENCHVLAAKNNGNSKKSKLQKRFSCKVCSIHFVNINQMLQHKQKFHRAPKLHRRFSATCFGCEKYFLSKLALTNHMKYICQSLSLRCIKTQLKTFKCRFCQSISFTHWRLYRNHEIACKRKRTLTAYLRFPNLALQQRKSLYLICTICRQKFCNIKSLLHHYNMGTICKLTSVALDCAVKCRLCQQHFQLLTELIIKHECKKATEKRVPKTKKSSGSLEYLCDECSKVFASSKNLYQHRITHTQEKRHKCGLCPRVFKRRGGLTQHMKGFHLQLKPYECEICKHRYALKGDMQRCRHSLLHKRNGADLDNIVAGTALDIC